MDGALWGRKFKLDIGDGTETFSIDGTSGEIPRVRFDVHKNVSGYYGQAVIEVYGLSEESRRKVRHRYTSVSLSAGYESRYGNIFRGQIGNVGIGRNGPENIVTIYAAAIPGRWKTAFVNRSFGAGTPLKDVIEAVAGELGKPVTMQGDFGYMGQLQDTLPVSMDAKAWLMTNRAIYGFEFLVDQDMTIVYARDHVGSTSHRIGAQTGMEGTPTLTDYGAIITTRLMPQINVRDKVELVADTANIAYGNPAAFRRDQNNGKIYTVRSFSHSGDSYGDRWSTIIDGYAPSVASVVGGEA